MSGFVGQWLLFLYLNMCAGMTAALWSLRDGATRSSIQEFSAAWLTLFLGLIVFCEMSLGSLGLLTVGNLAAVLTVFLLGSLALTRNHRKREGFAGGWSRDMGAFRRATCDGDTRMVMLLAAWLCAAIVIGALAQPSLQWDSLCYHMPMVVDWMQHKALVPAYIPGAEIANSYFPGNGELLYYWVFAPFKNDLLVRTVNIGMWLTAGIGIYRLGRKLGAAPRPTLASTLLILAAPIVVGESVELMLDLAAAAVFLLAIGHMIEFARAPRLAPAGLFGIAAGISTGIKYSGPPFLLVLLAAFGLIAAWRLRRQGGWKTLGYCAIVAAGIAVLGSYWYLRNLILAGNPLFPLQISLAGRVIFAGSGIAYFNRLWDHFGAVGITGFVQVALGAYGYFYVLGLIVAAGQFGLFLWDQRKGRPDSDRDTYRPPWLPLGIVSGITLASLILYCVTPYSVMIYAANEPITLQKVEVGTRLNLNAFILSGALLAVGLSTSRRFSRFIWFAVLGAQVQTLLSNLGGTHPLISDGVFSLSRVLPAGVLVGAGILVVEALGTRRRIPLDRLRRSSVGMAVLALAAVLVVGGVLYQVQRYREVYRFGVYQRAFGDFVPAWQWVDENIHDANIAYSGTPLPYPLYGQGFSNQVRYVNTEGSLDDRQNDFVRRPGASVVKSSKEAWLRNLAAYGGDYWILSGDTNPPEAKWARQDPERFALVFANPKLQVYQIR